MNKIPWHNCINTVVLLVCVRVFTRQSYALPPGDGGRVGPQQRRLLALVEQHDVPRAHLQPQAQLRVEDTETTKVGAAVPVLNGVLLANNLAVHHKA